jgi:hypothetical protein
MKKLFILLSLIMCLFINNVFADSVYKWVDENGVTHYGDSSKGKKKNGAKEIQIKTPPKIGSVAVNYVPQPQPIKKDQNENITNYNIVVTSPTQDEQVWANNGIINVSTNIRPKPQGDFSLKIYIDNSLYESVNNSTKASVSAVPRGEHTIFVKLQTRNGKIYTSNSVKFYVLKTNVQLKKTGK